MRRNFDGYRSTTRLLERFMAEQKSPRDASRGDNQRVELLCARSALLSRALTAISTVHRPAALDKSTAKYTSPLRPNQSKRQQRRVSWSIMTNIPRNLLNRVPARPQIPVVAAQRKQIISRAFNMRLCPRLSRFSIRVSVYCPCRNDQGGKHRADCSTPCKVNDARTSSS